MGLLTSLITGAPLLASTPGPMDDFWYGPVGSRSAAGPFITQETALSISTVYACVSKLAKALEIAPLHLNEQLPEDEAQHPRGIRRATDRPLYRLLHDQPNARQTAPEFWGATMAHLALRGTFTARMIFRGPEVAELDPIHPDRVEVTLLPTRRRGFRFTREDGTHEALTQDEVFHVVGLSLDGGKTGVSVLKYAKETLGLARATEDYAGRTFRQGALHRGVLTHPGRLGPQAHENLRASIVEQTAGPTRWHQPLILEEGMQWKEMTMTPEDTQLLLSRRFSVAEVARWFDVPLVMINETDRSTSWGTGIESLMQGFVTWSVLPFARRIEAAIKRDLIAEVDRERLSAKFLLDALLRADTATRFAAYATGIQNGFMAENEARLREDLNPIDGLWEPRRSANQDRGGDPRGPQPPGAPERGRPRPDEEEDDSDSATARARQVVRVSASALVRKETAALRKWAPRFEGDREGWVRWATDFYGDHAEDLGDRLALDVTVARHYTTAHCAEVLEQGLNILDAWELEAPAQLVGLVLGHADVADHLGAAVGTLARALASRPTTLTVQPAAVSIPVTVQPAAPATVTLQHQHETRIEPGAVRVEVPVTVETPAPIAIKVEKRLVRDKSGRAEGTIETHTPLPRGRGRD